MITLETLPQATAQEVFDQVVTHLLTQKEKCGSVNIGGKECLYVNEAGLHCAAGCLIGDDEVARNLDRQDNAGWHDLVSLGLVPKNHYQLIQKLQEVHDNYGVERWEDKLRDVARGYGLTFNGPKDDTKL